MSTPEDDRDWEWVWEDESDDEAVEEELKAIPIRDPSKDLDAVSAVSESTSNISNGGSMIEHKLEKVKDIIAKPEEKWRQLPSPTGSTRSSNAAVTGSVSIQVFHFLDSNFRSLNLFYFRLELRTATRWPWSKWPRRSNGALFLEN